MAAIGLPLLGCSVMARTNGPALFEVKELTAPVSDVTISWTSGADEAWQTRAPLLEIADPANPAYRAKGWLAATRDELLVRLDVYDAVHTNAFTGRKIRDGDFIRLAFDGRGDGPGKGPADTDGMFGADDAAMGFALAKDGPEGWTYDTMIPEYADAYPRELLAITRDEAAKITRYGIRVPWKRLDVRPGVFPQFGLSIQLQNADSPRRDAARLTWGGNANEPKATYFRSNRPGLYKKIGWENPPHEIVAAAPAVTHVWEKGGEARFVAAVASEADVVIRASMGAASLDHRVPGRPDRAMRRFSLIYRPAEGVRNETVKVVLYRKKESEPVDALTADVVIAETVVQALFARLDDLIAAGGHPLFLRHLKSVKAMAQTEWARASVYKGENPDLAAQTLKHIGALLAGFNGRSGKWESYLNEGQPLFMAYASPRDGTLQWYALTLPKSWDPAKHPAGQAAYPLFFELHGRSDPHYLFYPAAHLGAAPADPALVAFAMRQRNGYHVYPFGRGNSGYRDIGETDVWEAYADVQKTVTVDPGRRYLYGFSMGGSGAWQLGSRTPDQWAAIASTGSGVRVEPWGQAGNVSGLPIYLWGGEVDTLGYGTAVPPLAQMRQFAKAIEEAGGSVTVRSTPGIGHNYRIKEQEELVNWLQQWTRKRPDAFSFTADTDLHREAWGITVPRRSLPTELPRFTCKVEGNVVRVEARDCSHIDIQLGPNGLAMTGTVTLIVNGQERYRGEATSHRFDLQAE